MKDKLKLIGLGVLAAIAIVLWVVFQKKGIDLQKYILDIKKKMFDDKITANQQEIAKIDTQIQLLNIDNTASKETIAQLEKQKSDLHAKTKEHEATAQELADKFNKLCGG